MRVTKAMSRRIDELNAMSSKLGNNDFYCDFGSTVESAVSGLTINWSNKFIWIVANGRNAWGNDPIKERITLSKDDARDDFNYWTKELRKGLVNAVKYR